MELHLVLIAILINHWAEAFPCTEEKSFQGKRGKLQKKREGWAELGFLPQNVILMIMASPADRVQE